MTGKHVRRRWLWVAFGVVLAAILAYVGRPFFSMMVVGLFFYYVTRPVFHFFNRIRWIPRLLASFIAVFLVLLPVSVVVAYTITVAVMEEKALISNLSRRYGADISAAYKDVRTEEDFYDATSRFLRGVLGVPPEEITSEEDLEELKQDRSITGRIKYYSAAYMTRENIGNFLGELKTRVRAETVVGNVFLAVTIILGLLARGFMALIFAFVFLHFEDRIKRFIKESVLDRDAVSLKFLRDVDSNIESVYMGTILTIVISGLLAAATLGLFSLSPHLPIPYPVLLGLLCGVVSLLPMIGMKLVYIPLFIYLLVMILYVNPFSMAALGIFIVFVAVMLVVVDTVPTTFLMPFMARLPYHVVLVMFSYFFGLAAFRELGIFLGPIILILTANFIKTIWPSLRDSFV